MKLEKEIDLGWILMSFPKNMSHFRFELVSKISIDVSNRY